MKSLTDLLQECEADLRAGQGQQVAKRLAKLNSAKVPREYRLRLANICRRAGLIAVGLRLLSPVIHSETDRNNSDATSEELAEYAVLLQRSGALEEALSTLGRVDTDAVPAALLYRAFCRFNRWQYEEAIPDLKDYLKNPPSDYMKIVGQVNLAAALLATDRIDEAQRTLAQVIESARAQGFSRLVGNSLEMRAQVHITKNDFAQAKSDLDEAMSLFGPEQTLDHLFVRKWKAVLASIESSSPLPLMEFRQAAQAQRDWESVREADLFALKIQFDKDKLDHLYFGTPFGSYRERVRRKLGTAPEETSYIFGKPGSPTLDLLTGEIEGFPHLTAGGKVHQCLEILTRDFYRPISLGGLFAELFPWEYFEIDSSPNRVHQIIRRTRRWLEDARLPMEVIEDASHYSVRITGDFALLVPLERGSVEWHELQLQKLRSTTSALDAFSASEARTKLGLSVASFKRLASWALEHGKFEKLGAGCATLYRLRT